MFACVGLETGTTVPHWEYAHENLGLGCIVGMQPTEFSAKFPRKQGYTRDTASRFLVPCQGLAPEPQGQFLPLLPMATTAKNAHENGHILFRFFWVFFAVSNDLCRAKV